MIPWHVQARREAAVLAQIAGQAGEPGFVKVQGAHAPAAPAEEEGRLATDPRGRSGDPP
ncbi:MAG: hypothetical protein ACJ75H_18925 [Thermoanaerobaculia bacterium]